MRAPRRRCGLDTLTSRRTPKFGLPVGRASDRRRAYGGQYRQPPERGQRLVSRRCRRTPGYGRVRGNDRRRRWARFARFQPRSRDLPGDRALGRRSPSSTSSSTTSPSTTASCARSSGGRRRSSAGRRACTRASSSRRASEGGGDAFFQKRIPRGAPDYVQTARIQFPSGRHADEICPTELAVVGWAAQMGTITFHPWPVRREDVDHPDELRIDLDPQPGTDFADAVRVAAEARVLLGRARLHRFPEDLGRPGRPHLRPDRAALDVHRRPPRGDRVRPRARAASARPGDDQVVEGGARRAHLHRLQPECARPHDRLGLQRAAEAGCAGLRAAGVGRARRGRARGLHGRDDARALRRGGRSPRGDRRRRPLAAAAARHVRARRRRGTAGTCPTRPTIRRCRASRSACSPRATATVRGNRDRDRP